MNKAIRINSVAVDFDGTLALFPSYPNIGKPNLPLIKVLKDFSLLGGKIILWTQRYGGKLKAAVDWCYRQGLPIDYVNENLPESKVFFSKNEQEVQDPRKVYADLYIDDHAFNVDRAIELLKMEVLARMLERAIKQLKKEVYGVSRLFDIKGFTEHFVILTDEKGDLVVTPAEVFACSKVKRRGSK